MSDELNEGRTNPPPPPDTPPPDPMDVDPEEILDWDTCIEVAPPRPTRRIQVTLRDMGRDKPLPVDIDPFK